MKTDPSIRALLLPQLRTKGSLVVQEWGIGHNSLIVDVARINADTVEAYEIKSASDSLARLPRQVPLYSSLFDRCTLVVAGKHSGAARDLIPPWWGIKIATEDGIKTHRYAIPNPSPYCTAGLLWRDEIAQIVKHFGFSTSNRGKVALLDVLKRANPSDLGDLVCAALHARTQWRSEDGRHVKREARRAIREKRKVRGY